MEKGLITERKRKSGFKKLDEALQNDFRLSLDTTKSLLVLRAGCGSVKFNKILESRGVMTRERNYPSESKFTI